MIQLVHVKCPMVNGRYLNNSSILYDFNCLDQPLVKSGPLVVLFPFDDRIT